VNVTKGRSETLVLDKDSNNRLWVAYVESEVDVSGSPTRTRVMVNHSTTDDATWGEPYELPVAGAGNLGTDDIASLIAFHGKIGIMWSNRTEQTMYFASHADGAEDTAWTSFPVYGGNGADAVDDHINLKLQSDGTGIYAVLKTSFVNSADPEIVLVACTNSCATPTNWRPYIVYQVQDQHTRPILLVDSSNRAVHIFTTTPEVGGAIYHKVWDMDTGKFGPMEPFIRSSTDTQINNATSTKQTVNSTTGLVVLASDVSTRFYLHNYLSLGDGNRTFTDHIFLPLVNS
jgi:hypothetical protein